MDSAAFRRQFPVLERVAYLNAGTCGPYPDAALQATVETGRVAADEGRTRPYFERTIATLGLLRAFYAQALRADERHVALTTCTGDGVARALASLRLEPGDEILIARDEHPGLLGPVGALRDRTGAVAREVALSAIADEVTDATRLVACSHVAWTSGEIAPRFPDGLCERIPILLDGAQGVGAIDVDVTRLGCSFYAGSGQKWMCGPVGTGMLWISPTWRERLRASGPSYINLEDASAGLDARTWPDARAFDTPAMSLETASAALASARTLSDPGWDAVWERSSGLAAQLARRLEDAGLDVLPRGASTLVTWRADDAEQQVARLAEQGVIVRSFPGLPLIRASVGAWNDEDDLDRLTGLIAA